MIRDLFTPEAQRDWYEWLCVMMAHTLIGLGLYVAAWIDGSGGIVAVAVVYVVFERVQAVVSGRLLWWDSILDWCAVAWGAGVAERLLAGDRAGALICVLCAGITGIAGVWVRR